jgi:hypothetical protein
LDSCGNGRRTMFIEVTAMVDGGGSIAREESADGLLYTRVRRRGGSQVHHDGKVTVWRRVRRRRRAGTAETPVAGGGKVGAFGHGARGAWRKGSGGRKAVRHKGGSTACRLEDQGQPRRAGPAEPRGGGARRRRASWSAELWRVASKFRFSPV